MATITKDIADAESRVRARAQFQRELIEESNRLMRENPTVPFKLGEENSDAVKTEISKRTGIPFSPPKKEAEKTAEKTVEKPTEKTETKASAPLMKAEASQSEASGAATAQKSKASETLSRDKPTGAAPSLQVGTCSLQPSRQTILTEFEVIPDNEKVTVNEGTQQPRKMHAGPRMFNFGFSFNPAPAVSKAQKPKEK